ncbi:hypothetical protein E2320_021946 [Naja naja]|nr:hypothetical protein E2320_021946 [Naja naja]
MAAVGASGGSTEASGNGGGAQVSSSSTAATTTTAPASSSTPSSSSAAAGAAAAAASAASSVAGPPQPAVGGSAGPGSGAAISGGAEATAGGGGGGVGSAGSSSSTSSASGAGGAPVSSGASESWYVALLGLAEHFRTSSPPKVRLCVHCLQAVLPRKPPARVEARTHLQLGSVLYHHTRNGEQARGHLEKAIPQFEDVKFEAASLLSELYCQENSVDTAKPLLPLFLLSKGMLLLMERKLQEVHPLLTLCGQIVENWQGNPIQKESLRVFFLVLQVKSVKPCLKQLQQCIQTISTLHDDEILPSNPADLFHWLPKEHMCVLVYLVTVMHSMQAGYLEKAQKYTDKALMQLEKLKMLDCSPILSSFQGLYCITVNCMDNAEAQFTTALRLTTHQELWAFIVTNLASVYIREGNRHQELYSLLERINPDHNFPVSSHCLRAAAFYIRGLFSFFQGRYNEAKRFLRETLKMSNAEDLNRLTACSLVLLGHIFYVLGNHRESNNMVVPAMQLASKIPDMSVQLWSSALLRDLNKACGNAIDAHEAAQMHQNFSQQLLQDHIEALDRWASTSTVSGTKWTYHQPGQSIVNLLSSLGKKMETILYTQLFFFFNNNKRKGWAANTSLQAL